ncbi:MAG TPA: bifunctional oligoribonuclease/PAP phosphatase NrnA [Longimicrobiaceae bacterium]|nr:bifunctional oligoribonuclease/PAP phosphatase NrnA [Longimicrobiaceae bacterium]
MLTVPPARAAALREALDRLLAARHVVLTTHVNADGDGAGSEAAVAAWLEGQGIRASILNPTPFPDQFRFLLTRPEGVVEWADGEGAQVQAILGDADLFLVLDTSEAPRLAGLAERLPPERTLVIDHHPPGPTVVGSSALQDPTAAATGELVYDLICLAGDPLQAPVVAGIYVAIVTDTGSFRYSNTSPRVHAIAAELVQRGVDPEEMYRRLFATFSLRRIELLREALGTLQADPETPIAWLVLSDALIRRTGATAEDIEGLIEYARSIEGTEVALLFRELPDGRTKISFRSTGAADVNRIARQFGGGGHLRASGATAPESPAQVIPRVLAAARDALATRDHSAQASPSR